MPIPAPRETGRGPVFAVVLAALFLALASPVLAQTTLSGIVHDPNGRVAAAVPLVAERLGDGDVADARWETISTEIGYYEFTKLPPGHYRITIELPPFRPVTADVTVQTQRRAVLDIALRLGSDERVTVQGNASPRPLGAVELSGVATVAQFSRTELDTLPLSNGRTVQSVQLLVPGLLVTDSVGTLAQFTAVGQRRFANRMTIDGVSADLGVDVRGVGIAEGGSGTLPAFATSGGTQTIVPMEAIQEIQVRTTNAAPEFARTPGAQTAIVTRAGGDRLTGTGFLANRPNGLTASDWFANAGQAPWRALDFWNAGASIGGPALPGRLFYFATWESQRVDRPMTMTSRVPSVESREAATEEGRPWLNAFPAPNGAELEGGLAEYNHAFPVRSDLSTLSLRLDAPLGGRHRLFARVNRGRSSGDALADSTALPFYSFSNREAAASFTATAGWTATLASAMTHDLRVNVSRNQGTLGGAAAPYGGAQPLALDGLVPASLRADAWVFFTAFTGASGFVQAGRTGESSQQQVELSDTFSLVHGRHQWRFGATFNHLSTSTDAAANRFTYRFGSVGEVATGRIRNLVVANHLAARATHQTFAAFVQDTVRLTPRLSIDAGLRYRIQPAPTSGIAEQPLLIDYEALPEMRTLPAGSALWATSWTDLAPHVGATYQLGTTAGHETTVRAGWSLAFDDLVSPGVTALSQGYPFVTRRVVAGARLPVPESDLTGSIPAFAPGDVSDYFALPRNLRAPRTANWQLGIEQALNGAQRVSVAYVGASARDLLYRSVYQPLDRQTNVTAYSNDAQSSYHALLGEYVRRLSSGLQMRAVYTWSHAIDTDSGESLIFNPPPWLLSPELNRGSSDFDRRHALQVSATYRLPAFSRLPAPWRAVASDWQVDVVGMLRSGAPINLAANAEFGGAPYAARPDLVPGQPLWVADPTSPTGQRLNPAAFGPDPSELIVDRQGTLGRNVLRASWLRQIDLAVSRSFRVRGMTLQLRAEAFNVFNLPNFGSLVTTVGNVGFGAPFQSYADTLGSGTLTRGGLVPVQQVGGPRSLQFTFRVGL